MDRLKFYKILIIILVLLNIGTLATIWIGRMRGPGMMERQRFGEPLLRELQLTPRQRSEFREQRRMHMGQLKRLQSLERDRHETFFNLVFSENPDSTEVIRMVDSILEIRREMELMTYRHFKKIQGMLNPVQKEEFRKNFKNHFDQVLPPPRPVKDIPEPPPPPAKMR